MKNIQPFITTDELREGFGKWTADEGIESDWVIAHEDKIADFWLQKMSEHRERLIKEVDKLSFSDVQAKKGWTGLKETIIDLIQERVEK